jgi:riboflavin synthase
MFTGLIEAVGEVDSLRPVTGGYRLRVLTPLSDGLKAGDSVAVSGVCLTVTDVAAGGIEADIGPETARVTTLGGLTSGDLVNLERPLRADGRLGGHFVLGHVDFTGEVVEIRQEAEFVWYGISFPRELERYLIPKGSIAIDGISLTVATLGIDSFDVMIIPFTLEHTNLKAVKVGDRVNLECDVIGKYVVRLAELGQFSAVGSPGVPTERKSS